MSAVAPKKKVRRVDVDSIGYALLNRIIRLLYHYYNEDAEAGGSGFAIRNCQRAVAVDGSTVATGGQVRGARRGVRNQAMVCREWVWGGGRVAVRHAVRERAFGGWEQFEVQAGFLEERRSSARALSKSAWRPAGGGRALPPRTLAPEAS